MRRRAAFIPLSVKLGAILLASITVTFGVVYLWVVPRLESELVDDKIAELSRAAGALEITVVTSPLLINDALDIAARTVNARVVLYQRIDGERIAVWADSDSTDSRDVANDPVAVEANARGRRATGRVSRDSREFAEVAVPVEVDPRFTLLLSSPTADAVNAVTAVRRSILIAGGIGLAVAWLAGSMATLRLVRRVRRLEEAAGRIADGELSVPVEDEGRDEIAQLAHAFEQMRVRLEHLEIARREFIANASHELKTPLFAVGGFLELMQDEEIDDETRREFVQQMDDQVKRLTRLTSDLLDLSRLDAGHLAIGSDPVDINECAFDLVQQFAPIAEHSGHELMEGSAVDVAMAIGDTERVLRIGSALVENGIRHTPAGTTIYVSTGHNGKMVELQISDDGPGIPAEDQEHVFERFYRGGSELAYGSGLGLSIARELAERMGGRLEVVSSPKGTRFFLQLPPADAAAFPREKGRKRLPRA